MRFSSDENGRKALPCFCTKLSAVLFSKIHKLKVMVLLVLRYYKKGKFLWRFLPRLLHQCISNWISWKIDAHMHRKIARA